MLSLNRQYHLSGIVIVIVATVFAILVGAGLYGYGHDYYRAYNQPNLEWGLVFDRLGFLIATFTIYEIHLGVQLVTFILSISTGLLLREHIKFRNSYSLIFFTLLLICTIHTWPIIMSTSNAMRQGLSMSFIFLAFIFSSRQKFYLMTIFCLLGVFTHKSGLLLALIVIFSFATNRIFKNFSVNKKTLIHFIIGALLFISSYFVLDYVNRYIFTFGEGQSRIIGGDFRGPFILISSLYIILSFFYRRICSNAFNLSLYYFSFISPALLLNGLNWEYERLCMMMLIPYVLAFGILLNKISYKLYLTTILFLLLILTIFTGMYASLT